MKKLMLLYIVLISMTLCISCGSGGNDDSEEKKGSIKRYRLSLITQYTEGTPAHRGALAFAKKLSELSEGTMVVDINQIDVNNYAKEIIEPVIKGESNILLTASGYSDLSYKIPELEIMGQAYIFKDYEHFLEFRETEYAQSIREKIADIGLISSVAWYYGVRHTTSNIPIQSLNDFRGLKLRVPPIDSSIAFAESMGAIALPMGFVSLYDALENGHVHAQENSLSIIESTKLYRVQEYIAMTSHAISLAVPMINKTVYDTFSSEQEAWYNEALEYGRQVCSDLTTQQENYLLEKFEKEYDMVRTYPNIDELRAAMKPYYDKLEKLYGNGSVSKIIEIRS